MARVIWKGHISFGLVTIPVGLHPATDDHDLSLTLIDRRDQAPIGYKRVNKRTGKEVAYDDIVKAYEVEEGEYVVLTEEDFAAANVEASQTVDIVAFVDQDAVEPRYHVKPYYVAPTKKSGKAYALLRETMRRTGKVAVAKVVLRTRQYVAMLYPLDDVLVLELLRYHGELRSFEELELPGSDLKKLGVTDRELEMAEQLVEGLADEWQPEAFRDEYHADLMRIIEEKARTGEVKVKPVLPSEEGAEVIDIMTLLKRSLASTGKAGGKAATTGKAGGRATRDQASDRGNEAARPKAARKKATAAKKTTASKPKAASQKAASKTASQQTTGKKSTASQAKPRRKAG